MKRHWLTSISAAATMAISGLMVSQIATAATPASTASLAAMILPHLEQRQTTFTLNIGSASFNQVMPAINQALETDDYLREDYHGSSVQASSGTNGTVVTFHISYNETASQYQYVKNRVSTILKRIISPSMNAVQKEKAIHDYIVLHVAYDETLKNVSPYEALTKGTVVCQGYAMLAYEMFRDAGIPCHIVNGTADGQSHAWNEVKIDGHWYDLDVTWDDPVPDQPGHVHYDYFNLTDAQMKRDHQWTAPWLPAANTNFVTWLTTEANATKTTPNPYQQVLQSTGLYLETAAHTDDTVAQLQRAVSGFRGTTLSLRYPYASLQSAIGQLRVSRSFRVEYQQDARDPAYAIVTFTFA